MPHTAEGTPTVAVPSADAGCGCHPAAHGTVSRRAVVRAGAMAGLLAGAATVGGGATAQYAFAEAFPHTNPVSGSGVGSVQRQVLVVISLRGGFDGLNAIVPAADPRYAALRPTVGVPTSRLIRLNPTFGMHPAMAPLLPFWKAGTFGVVHAVGQVEPTRSHFAAMQEMERAAPGTSLRTGWLDRLLSVIPETTTFRATQLGGGALLGSLIGSQPELLMQSIEKFRLNAAWNDAERARWVTALKAMYAQAPTSVRVPAAAVTAAVTRTAAMGTTYVAANGASYPETDLGTTLADTARLIKSGVGLRVAAIDYGEWDLHSDSGSVDGGNFATMLGELAAAMAAFATDLGAATMRNVTVVTLSEFGRRVAENGSGGTDHGLGNAVLMLGGGVLGARVHGRWPTLAPAALVDGDLAGTTDYRLLLAEIATKRFGVPSATAVFPGLSGAPLGVVRHASSS